MLSKKQGFTLIELLVVIAIIAILAAILFPVFTSAKRTAKITQCGSNLHQVAVAVNMYCSDSGGNYPLWMRPVPAYPTVRGGSPASLSHRCWRDDIFKYIKSSNLMICVDRSKDCAYGDGTSGTPNITNARAADLKLGYLTSSYSMNYSLAKNSDPGAPMSAKDSEVRKTSKTFLLAESGRWGYNPMIAAYDPDALVGRPAGWTESTSDFGWNAYNKYAIGMHNDGGNVAYCDGHVKYMKYKEWNKLCLAVNKLAYHNQYSASSDLAEGWEFGGCYLISEWQSKFNGGK